MEPPDAEALHVCGACSGRVVASSFLVAMQLVLRSAAIPLTQVVRGCVRGRGSSKCLLALSSGFRALSCNQMRSPSSVGILRPLDVTHSLSACTRAGAKSLRCSSTRRACGERREGGGQSAQPRDILHQHRSHTRQQTSSADIFHATPLRGPQYSCTHARQSNKWQRVHW